MRVRARKQTDEANGGPWLTYEQLGQRWGRSPKTVANLIARGAVPLRAVRLYEGADPLFHRADVENYEGDRMRAAGIEVRG
jgi:hypothetical protein